MKCECGREYEGSFCPSCGKPASQQLSTSQGTTNQTTEGSNTQNQQQVSSNQYATQQTVGYSRQVLK